MKLIIYNFILLVVQATSDSSGPPPPNQNKAPQLPIDDHLWVILVVGLLFGIYIAYKKMQATRKAA